jgi:VIT1/CCC1 family predicted Fe2+/Mn2+ transporter
MLRTMAQTELGLSDERLPNPWVSAVSATVSTAIGAFIPVVPFFFMTGAKAVVTAAIVSIVAHFVVGAAKSLVTVRSWWSSGLEMTLVGILAGSVTYILGLLFGAVGA